MYLYIYIYINTYIQRYVYMYVYIHIYIYICIHTYIHIRGCSCENRVRLTGYGGPFQSSGNVTMIGRTEKGG